MATATFWILWFAFSGASLLLVLRLVPAAPVFWDDLVIRLAVVAIRSTPYLVAAYLVGELSKEFHSGWVTGMSPAVGPLVLSVWSGCLLLGMTASALRAGRGSRDSDTRAPDAISATVAQLGVAFLAFACLALASWTQDLTLGDANPYWVALLTNLSFSTVVVVLSGIAVAQSFMIAELHRRQRESQGTSALDPAAINEQARRPGAPDGGA
jgi:hypothetical protein